MERIWRSKPEACEKRAFIILRIMSVEMSKYCTIVPNGGGNRGACYPSMRVCRRLKTAKKGGGANHNCFSWLAIPRRKVS